MGEKNKENTSLLKRCSLLRLGRLVLLIRGKLNLNTRYGKAIVLVGCVLLLRLLWSIWRYEIGLSNEGRSSVKLQRVEQWKANNLYHYESALGLSTSTSTLRKPKIPSSGSKTEEFKLTDDWLEQCANRLAGSNPPPPPFDPGRLQGYAIGDCIKMCSNRGALSFPYRSILNDYYRRACPASNSNFVLGGNLPVLKQILEERDDLIAWESKFTKPPKDAVVIHLRLGDVIEMADDTALTMLQKGAPTYSHHGYIRSVHQYLQEIQWTNLTKVELVGGSHYVPATKSRIYTGCLYEALARHGYDVTLRTDGYSPDQDFYYMAHAKQIILSTGGFTLLIGQMVTKLFGGKVVGTNVWNQQQWDPTKPFVGTVPPPET